MTMLRYIKSNHCPQCGAHPVSDERYPGRKHCSGVIPERRTFECGYAVEFLGNFNIETPAYQTTCSKNATIIADRQKATKHVEHLLQLTAASDLSSKYKELIVNAIKGTRWHIER